jgi:hypothetical protein
MTSQLLLDTVNKAIQISEATTLNWNQKYSLIFSDNIFWLIVALSPMDVDFHCEPYTSNEEDVMAVVNHLKSFVPQFEELVEMDKASPNRTGVELVYSDGRRIKLMDKDQRAALDLDNGGSRTLTDLNCLTDFDFENEDIYWIEVNGIRFG